MGNKIQVGEKQRNALKTRQYIINKSKYKTKHVPRENISLNIYITKFIFFYFSFVIKNINYLLNMVLFKIKYK